jgi:hypothetical protein
MTEAGFSKTEHAEEGTGRIGGAGSEEQLADAIKRALEMGEAKGTGSDARVLQCGEQIRESVGNTGLKPLVTIIRVVRGEKALDEGLDVRLGHHILIMPNDTG